MRRWLKQRISSRHVHNMQIMPHLHIDEQELKERFTRASGPGGQHVNKTATAVQLRFDAAHSSSLPAEIRTRLLALNDPHVTVDGQVIIFADRYRSQARNRADARERLATLVARAAQRPKKRRRTRVPRRAKRRRLDNKKHAGRTKRLRKRPPPDD